MAPATETRVNEVKGLTAGLYRPSTKGVLLSIYRPHTTLLPRAAVVSTDPLTQQVIVPDVSFWQDKNTTARGIDFFAMKNAGAKGVIIRGGQNTWVDQDFDTNWAAAKQAGLPRGSYYFLDPRAKPQDQADLWSEKLIADPPELDIWADYEAPDSWGGAYAGYDGLYNFLERLKVNLPTLKKSIYTGYYYWLEHGPSNQASLQYFAQYGLDIAYYTNNPAFVRIPPPWTAETTWWWQYTDNGDGPLYGTESLNVDLNWCQVGDGSLLAYTTFFNLGGVTPPPPPSGGLMIEVRSTVPSETRSIRNGPGVKFSKVGDLPAGGVGQSHGATADIFNYPNDVPDASIPGGLSAKAGDQWIRIFAVNGVNLPVTRDNWLAVKHLGVTYTTKTVVPDPEPPIPVTEVDVQMRFKYDPNNGNVVVDKVFIENQEYVPKV